MDAVGDDERLASDRAAVSDLQVLGVEPEVGVGALERTLAERFNPLVEAATERRDPVLAHCRDAQLLDQAVDLAGRDAARVGLHDDADDRLPQGPRGSRKLGK